MERAEAEAIYVAGRDACVQALLDLASGVERLEDRLRRLEEQARRDSRTSSKPPSQDPPKTRQQRRAQARAKAKELLAGEGAKRKAGAQEGHRGAGRGLAPEDQVDEIVDHFLPPLLEDEDGFPILPHTYCGIRVIKAEEFGWFGANGTRIDPEAHGTVRKMGDEYYLGGIEFRGPITTCAAAKSDPQGNRWHFPVPLTLSGNEPQFHLGVTQLVIEFNPHTKIEFIDRGFKRLHVPGLYNKKLFNPPDLFQAAIKYLERVRTEDGDAEARRQFSAMCDWFPEMCEDAEFKKWIETWLPQHADPDRKQKVVLRLLQGESLEKLSAEIGESAGVLSVWRAAFLEGGREALRGGTRAAELRGLMRNR